ncbi:MAG: class I SAM-dependent methyltransferase [Burkholderiales bacterium]
MANFAPLKRHMLDGLDRFVRDHGLEPPFLDIGCGGGDLAEHLARRGWAGTAIDGSDAAIAKARARLARYPRVEVRKGWIDDLDGQWPTVLLWDVLEHLEDDRGALVAIARRMSPGGWLLIAVPSNPREWRWDDDFYGHLRRYTVEGLRERLAEAGLEAVTFEDFTFPVYWALRRAYTRWKRAAPTPADAHAATLASSTRNAWEMSFVSRWADRSAALWTPLNRLQHRLFRTATARGHEFFALARKR